MEQCIDIIEVDLKDNAIMNIVTLFLSLQDQVAFDVNNAPNSVIQTQLNHFVLEIVTESNRKRISISEGFALMGEMEKFALWLYFYAEIR